MDPSLEDLRRYAVARSLFTPTTLPAAIRRLGFVQADPIRAPARRADLTLRHRVKDYRAGDLESRYARLAIDEDCLVNYGFLPREHLALMHPRQARKAWSAETRRKAADVLDFVRARGAVHPREVDQHFAHGRVKNYWGGSSNASTQLLDDMHYRGLLRVKRRDSGTRVYEAVAHPPAEGGPAASARRAQALIDLVVRKYAPLPAASLTYLARLLGMARRTWRRRSRRRCGARANNWRAAASTAPSGTGPPTRTRARAATRSTSGCGSWLPSIPWSGTGAASRCSGTGRTSSRPIRRRPGVSSATTRCRCSGRAA